MPRIDAVAVSATDMGRTLAFYRLLGFTFPETEPDAQHVEAETGPGGTRLMVDDAALMESLIGEPPRPGNHAAFAVLFDSPSGVDAAARAVSEAGYTVITEPWDAFWGQRYAVVADPEGYRVDLFASL